MEIHQQLEGVEGERSTAVPATFGAVVGQIMLVDLVFSLDSIITAVGMVKWIEVMIAAVVTSVALMMLFAGPVGRFVTGHPTIKMLALAFLVVIGVVLIAAGLDHEVPKGYVYFAMAFAVAVELLNIRVRKRRKRAAQPVHLRARYKRD
jgi:predicted tellurium resistance membrane protein TerC